MRASTIPVLKALLALLAVFFMAPVAAQQPRPDMMDRGTAMLLAEGPVAPGGTVDLAVRFLPNPGWHGYWSNPGDAGQGMTLGWTLPAGWTAGEPHYPVPQTLLIQGLMNHVYEGEHAVVVPLAVPATAPVGQAFPVTLFAQWLSCSDTLCVPQWATLTTTVQVGGQATADSRFDGWRASLPPLLDQPATFDLQRRALRIAIPLPASLTLSRPHVFIAESQLVDYAAVQTFWRAGDRLVVEIPRKGLADRAAAVSGILKLDDQGNGVRFAAQPGPVPTGGERIAGGEGEAPLAPLWLLLGGAVLGGLVLNLMPCVFPILSLKALTLARAGESEGEARREGVAYTAGVVLACLALGALLLVLRAGGSEIGWAFQLQEPGVVVALLVLAVLITANFAGLYELPSLAITRSGGRASAFTTGLLAAFVATPCTGPFMAAALGAALVLPWWQGMLLFGALGLGLALPFLLLGFVPPLRAMLPKPGKWMDTFRRILAVPMALTALALAWLAWRLGGAWFALAGLVLAVQAASVALILTKTPWTARISRKLMIVAALSQLLIPLSVLPRAYAPPTAVEDSLLAPVAYSEQALAQARASGKPVFLWFTADWCLTCKVNEKVAIEREETKAAFDNAGVVAMRGDWTRRDPEITRFLTAHGAAGVPLYLWYHPNKAPQQLPQQLPQVLTPAMLKELAER